MMKSVRTSISFFAGCIGVLFLANSILQRHSSECSASDPDNGTASGAADAATAPLSELPLANSIVLPNANANPADAEISTGNWQSEEFAIAVQRQLEGLLELANHSQISVKELNRFVAESVDCSPFRPRELRPVFEVPGMTVYRPADDPPGNNGGLAVRSTRNAAQLSELLVQLRPSASPIHGKFKVVHVKLDDPRAVTHVLFHSDTHTVAKDAQANDELIQQNARWICEWDISNVDVPRLTSIDVRDYEEVKVTSDSRLFEDCTESVLTGNESYAAQLLHGTDHWRARLLADFDIGLHGHEGLAVADVNGDGREDLYVCQPGGLPNRLYLHQPDGTATDHSEASQLNWLDNTTGTLFVDLDNDGDQDAVLGLGESLTVCENNGTGRFDVAFRMELDRIPFSLAAADYDNDGLVDVFVCAYAAQGLPYAGGAGAPAPWHDANNGGANFLLRNIGQCQFRNVTAESGLDQNNRRFSFAAAWEDFDNDGDQDVYVANDFGRNCLYRNDGGVFTDVAAECGVEDMAAGMSVSWGDYDNDGWMDLYVGNMFSSAGKRIATQSQFHISSDSETRETILRHARGNSLFRNTGQSTFEDVSAPAGVTMGRWAWTSLFADWNNDGREDLIVANGFVTQGDTGDL